MQLFLLTTAATWRIIASDEGSTAQTHDKTEELFSLPLSVNFFLAQAPISGVGRLDPDHHELFAAFFQSHSRDAGLIDRARGANPSKAAEQDARLAKRFNISVKELGEVSRVSLAADTELKRHGRAIAQHVEAQKQVRKDPDQRELRRLDGQRYIATIAR